VLRRCINYGVCADSTVPTLPIAFQYCCRGATTVKHFPADKTAAEAPGPGFQLATYNVSQINLILMSNIATQLIRACNRTCCALCSTAVVSAHLTCTCPAPLAPQTIKVSGLHHILEAALTSSEIHTQSDKSRKHVAVCVCRVTHSVQSHVQLTLEIPKTVDGIATHQKAVIRPKRRRWHLWSC